MPRGARTVQTPGGSPETTSPSTDAADDTAAAKDDDFLDPEKREAHERGDRAYTESDDDEAYRERARTLRAKDVDATRLKRAVLTLDGWVCPATVPSPAVKQ